MNLSQIRQEAVKNNIEVKYSWIVQFLIALDQLGNVLGGGIADGTISARIGFNLHGKDGERDLYWKRLENIVDFTFYPLDGPKHCLLAYCSDKEEEYRGAKLFFRIVIAIIVVVFTILLFLPIRLISIFKPARTHYRLPNGTNIPYKDLESYIYETLEGEDPCAVLNCFAKKGRFA